MSQFTDEEAAQLKKFLELLTEAESSVYFVTPTIDLVRRERTNRLHSHEGEPVPGVDPVARSFIQKLKDAITGA